METVEFEPGPDRFALRATRALAREEVVRAVDSVIVARGLRGVLDRIGAILGLRREPACPT